MPVILLSKNFDNTNGSVNPFLKGNVGDKFQVEYKFQSSIMTQSGSNNFISRDPVQKIIYWPAGNFEDEGFRVDDTVNIRIYSSSGTLLYNDAVTVISVNGTALYVSDIPHWYSLSNNEIVSISVDTSGGRKKEGLIVDVNLVPNGQEGNEFSLIDGEVNRLFFDLINLPDGGTQYATLIGNRSGGAIESARIEDITDPELVDAFRYSVIITFTIWDIYNEAAFNTSGCLKFYAKTRWQSYLGGPFGNSILVVNDDADTGYFNQPFNQGVVDAVLTQSISEMNFDVVSTGTAIVESDSDVIAFGACYVPLDETYYKNKVLGMDKYAMLGASEFLTSNSQSRTIDGVDGIQYDLSIVRTVVGSTQQFVLTLEGNPAFVNFFNSRESGDRRFIIWVKVGNLNLTVFDGQLMSNPPVAGPLDFIERMSLNHGHNVQVIVDDSNAISANIEDDLCFVGAFHGTLGQPMTSLLAEIRAYNTDTNEFFSLQSVLFDIASVPIVGGRHVLNLSQSVFSSLPTTSQKRNALLVLDTAYDNSIVNLYGVRLVFPYLYRWETWLQQLNANNDFYPNKNKNWLQYGTTNPWILQLNVELIKNNLQYVFTENLDIKDYDSEPLLDNSVKVFFPQFVGGQELQAIPENQIMEIVAEHAINNVSVWNVEQIWGMITIEPTQSSPRWISSTVLNFDNNILNPLTPPAGMNKCELTFPAPNIARLRCVLDTSKIDMTNGIKITSKIHGNV